MRSVVDIQQERDRLKKLYARMDSVRQKTGIAFGSNTTAIHMQISVLGDAMLGEVHVASLEKGSTYTRESFNKAEQEAYKWVTGKSDIAPSQSWHDFFNLCAAMLNAEVEI
jgi:hypothetical protein